MSIGTLFLGMGALLGRLALSMTIVNMLQTLSPVGEAELVGLPGVRETGDERAERYQDIARDLADVLLEEGPLPGLTTRQSAQVMVAIAFHESRFARDVDLGPCARPRGFEWRCGYGQTVCLMQVDRTVYGVKEGDRPGCFHAAVTAAKRSYEACRAPDARLNQYASGSCSLGTSNTRMKLATAARLDFLAEDPVVR